MPKPPQDSDTGEEESTPPPTLGHESNRSFLAILGNYVLESRQHTVWLRSFYDEVRNLKSTAGARLEEEVLEEFERHHEAEAKNLAALRAHVRR